jgi:hypothetical protein
VQEVHDEALDVRPVVVLVRHDHERPVAQRLDVVVLLAVLQAQNLDEGRGPPDGQGAVSYQPWLAARGAGHHAHSEHGRAASVQRRGRGARACLMCWISAFSLIWLAVASRTFSSLPLRAADGNA